MPEDCIDYTALLCSWTEDTSGRFVAYHCPRKECTASVKEDKHPLRDCAGLFRAEQDIQPKLCSKQATQKPPLRH